MDNSKDLDRTEQTSRDSWSPQPAQRELPPPSLSGEGRRTEESGSPSAFKPQAAGSDSGASITSDEELLGKIYVGKYQLESIIGAGGMGVIYKGRQIFLDRVVAIKMLKSNLGGESARMRFHQEAKAASQLTHPGIVAINDFGLDELDRPYMVMEYVEGITLSDLLREKAALTVKDALPIFMEICDALSVAHHKGIVHRDLKPSNIMLVVDANNKVSIKLLDFGIAKLLDIQEQTLQSLTKTGEALGTPLYMSPEQILGEKITYRSDLYSLGCVMYMCLTGVPPFIGQNKLATMEKHCTARPVALRQASKNLESVSEIEPLILRLLEKEPSARFDSVDILKEALVVIASNIGLIRLPENPRESAFVSLPSAEISKTIVPGLVESSSSARMASRSERELPSKQSVENPALSERETHTRQDRLADRGNIAGAPNQEIRNELALDAFGIGRYGSRSSKKAPGAVDLNEGKGISRLESIEKLYSIIGLLMFFIVISGVTAGLWIWFSSSPKTQTIKQAASSFESTALETSADEIIRQKFSQGAVDASISLVDKQGLSAAGMRTLARFEFLRKLNLKGTNLKGGWLSYLANSRITYLNLDNNPEVKDFSLESVGKMQKLRAVSLSETGISDRGLRNLAHLKSLQKLNLGGNRQISDAGIYLLDPKNSAIVRLYLKGCDISDNAAESLVQFRSLAVLDLGDNAKISDRTIKVLRDKAPGIQNLLLAGDKITEKGIEEIADLKELGILDLSYITLNAKSIESIKKMKTLSMLFLRGCKLSPAQIKELIEALPNTRIEPSGETVINLEED